MDDTMNNAVKPVLFETLTANNGRQIGVITLNAEKTLNALSLEMIDLMAEQLLAWSTDDNIAMVLMQAAGEKAFCAGGDLQNLINPCVITMLQQTKMTSVPINTPAISLIANTALIISSILIRNRFCAGVMALSAGRRHWIDGRCKPSCSH